MRVALAAERERGARHPLRQRPGGDHDANGGGYKIVAPQRGARGLACDTLIFDELREYEDYDFIGAAKPTLTASRDPQTIYLSNAGSTSQRRAQRPKRRGEDGGRRRSSPTSSGRPARSAASTTAIGWAEANPALGPLPAGWRRSRRPVPHQAGTAFETEHLCRWVAVHAAAAGERRRLAGLPAPPSARSPTGRSMAINMDPTGRRASAVMAWHADRRAHRLRRDRRGRGRPDRPRPAGPGPAGADAGRHGAKQVAFASWTDKDLARYIPNAEAARRQGVRQRLGALRAAGRCRAALAWDGAEHVSQRPAWTARRRRMTPAPGRPCRPAPSAPSPPSWPPSGRCGWLPRPNRLHRGSADGPARLPVRAVRARADGGAQHGARLPRHADPDQSALWQRKLTPQRLPHAVDHRGAGRAGHLRRRVASSPTRSARCPSRPSARALLLAQDDAPRLIVAPQPVHHAARLLPRHGLLPRHPRRGVVVDRGARHRRRAA